MDNKIKFRSVPISEIINKNNPRLCLSPKRYLNQCVECEYFEKCTSRVVTKEQLKAFNEKKNRIVELKAQIKQAKKELKELK